MTDNRVHIDLGHVSLEEIRKAIGDKPLPKPGDNDYIKIVDYIGLMDLKSRFENDHLAEASQRLKALARELSFTVITPKVPVRDYTCPNCGTVCSYFERLSDCSGHGIEL